jgi:hypothetical protein
LWLQLDASAKSRFGSKAAVPTNRPASPKYRQFRMYWNNDVRERTMKGRLACSGSGISFYWQY